jgi:CheY-like chemotaxis protein
MGRLLVVDDDSEQLDVRCLVLRNAGHDVASALSAAAALESFETRRPDLVIMDLRLPRVEDGMRLLRELGAEARVVVLTGSRLQDGSVPGAARVLKKPCSSKTLLRAIAELA